MTDYEKTIKLMNDICFPSFTPFGYYELMEKFYKKAQNEALESAAVKCEKSDRYRGDYFAAIIRGMKDDVTKP